MASVSIRTVGYGRHGLSICSVPRGALTLIIVRLGRSWGGSRIIRYTRDGEMDLEVFFPTALNVTACAFGGKCSQP